MRLLLEIFSVWVGISFSLGFLVWPMIVTLWRQQERRRNVQASVARNRRLSPPNDQPASRLHDVSAPPRVEADRFSREPRPDAPFQRAA